MILNLLYGLFHFNHFIFHSQGLMSLTLSLMSPFKSYVKFKKYYDKVSEHKIFIIDFIDDIL